MSSPDTWLERYRRRYNWAVTAYDQFVRELLPELAEQIQRDEQITVVVYGATQVGKTTLILDLLGLSTRTSDEVANVLRGGQQLGKSATAMPIRYGRSEDDSWHIDGSGPLTANDARLQLGSIRRDVEEGRIHDAEVLDIRIPGRLFPPAGTGHLSLNLNIIDIPGINSRSEDERRLVSNLARKYVSVADLVLLVGRADSLGFLNAEDLQIEALAEWAAQPVRFRIVLTFSFSPDSLCRKFIESELSVDAVRDEIIREIRTHDYDFPDDFRANLFPLEMGDSIVALARSNPAYHQRIMEVTAHFREELLHDIALAAGPYARLYGAFQLDRVINARIATIRKERADELSRIEQRYMAVFRDLKAWSPGIQEGDEAAVQRAISEAKTEVQKLASRQSELAACLSRLDIGFFRKLFQDIPKDCTEETVSALQGLLQRCEEALQDICRSIPHVMRDRGVVSEWCMDGLPSVDFRSNQLLAIASRLDEYSMDSYFWSSNFKSDRSDLLVAVSKCADEHAGKAFSVMKSSLERVGETLVGEAKQQQLLLQLLERFLQRLNECQAERLAIRSRLAQDLRKMRDSRHLARHFESRLNAAFLSELALVRQEVRSQTSATGRFYSILQSKMLLSEIEKMYSGRRF